MHIVCIHIILVSIQIMASILCIFMFLLVDPPQARIIGAEFVVNLD